MPVVTVKLVKGAFSHEKTQQMMDNVTEAIVATAGEYIRPHVIVIVDEVSDGLYSSGGHKVTLKAIDSLRERAARSSATGALPPASTENAEKNRPG
jgi:4-oxalocrotonate tautomerase